MTKNNLTNNIPQCSLWTALITPFTEQGDIDFPSLAQAAQRQASAGNGILLLGSTGEGLALSAQEQLSIVEYICQLALDTPLMVAVGGYNLAEQLQWIERCNELPIHAYLLGTPIYAKPGPVGQTLWFSSLLDAAKFPCMLYNVPSRSGVEIPLTTMVAVQDHPNCWAMKEASGDLNKFLAYREQCPDIALFSGEDAMMPYLASAGAQGLVSVCSNAWPAPTHRYVELCLSGQNQGLFPLWQNAVDGLFQVANPIPVKVLMALQGEISSPQLRAPLTHLELAANHGLLDFNQSINQWYAQQLSDHVMGE
ncbi:4-hydroxy-tetrahydrodipicolinate synthase [Thalassotalea sp. PLHSN55]|uniref:4-hydroxy-tetrahydrodipicolinate synthase n=1 Tax=Thalassotalea sp. PLHSN55 TaxID=3435888 RepID=UPI003F86B665